MSGMDHNLFEQAFFHARLKINRADRHIDEAQQRFAAYCKSDFCRILDDTDPETGHQSIRAVAEPVPADLVLAIGDAFHCLSSSLEYVVSGLMMAKTGNATRVHFPTNETRKALRQSFAAPKKGKSSTATRRIVEAFPLVALKLLTGIKPYEGGDFALWEIRKADNIDKHNLIIPSVTVAQVAAVLVDDVHNNRFEATFGVGAGGVVNGIAYSQADGSRLKFEYKGQATARISFPDVSEVFAGDPVFPTLLKCSQLTKAAVDALEATAKRYL
tara:strand:- start:241 stop:1056 length:816 start_codon:yes stop_codon:yes gene_type:complete